MKRYTKFLQIKVDDKTIRQLRRIAKRNRRNMSDTVRMMIEIEDCRATPGALSVAQACGDGTKR